MRISRIQKTAEILDEEMNIFFENIRSEAKLVRGIADAREDWNKIRNEIKKKIKEFVAVYENLKRRNNDVK